MPSILNLSIMTTKLDNFVTIMLNRHEHRPDNGCKVHLYHGNSIHKTQSACRATQYHASITACQLCHQERRSLHSSRASRHERPPDNGCKMHLHYYTSSRKTLSARRATQENAIITACKLCHQEVDISKQPRLQMAPQLNNKNTQALSSGRAPKTGNGADPALGLCM